MAIFLAIFLAVVGASLAVFVAVSLAVFLAAFFAALEAVFVALCSAVLAGSSASFSAVWVGSSLAVVLDPPFADTSEAGGEQLGETAHPRSADIQRGVGALLPLLLHAAAVAAAEASAVAWQPHVLPSWPCGRPSPAPNLFA
jgi:hypothetical protein